LTIKAVIVDMDGTITRFNLDYMRARQRILEELERRKLRTPDMTDQMTLYMILDKLKDRMDVETFRALRADIYGYFEDVELKAAKEATLLPGAVDALQKLRSQSMKLGLVTTNGRKGTQLTLSRCGLQDIFDAVVTRDDVDQVKPAPEPVLTTLEKLNVASSETVLVGDGTQDIVAARAAGVQAVAVPTGPFTVDRLLQAEPDYLLGSIDDLPTLIEKLNSVGAANG
jgi:HAD superfamily hydrolase (TIGR01509 family)